MADSTLLRVRKGVWHGDTYIKSGTYHPDSSQVRDLPADVVASVFEPFEPDFGPAEPVVEQATAAPGEKRSTPRRRTHKTEPREGAKESGAAED